MLTLDADVQKITERALRNAAAAGAVVIDVDTGRVLALVSKPGFDPNEMSGHLSPEAEQRMLADRYHPLHDKTLSETYFPGSTFKAVSAIAALEDRLITPEEQDQVPRLVRVGAPPLQLHEDARRRSTCTTPSCRAATSTSTSWARARA